MSLPHIQKLFIELKNILNDKEDELLLEIYKKYEELGFNVTIVKGRDKFTKNEKIIRKRKRNRK